jgi:hypothetical protein
MTDAMETFGYTLDSVIIKFGMFIDKAPNLADKLGLGFINNILERSAKGWNYALGVDETRRAIQDEIWRTNTKIYADAAKNADAQAKKNKEYLDFLAKQKKLTTAAADAAKKQAAETKLLRELGGVFDLDQVQIYAALQNKITDDEKLRLSLQLALIQENVTVAQKLATQLVMSQLQTTNLAQAIAKLPPALYPFQGWSDDIDNLIAQLLLMMDILTKMPKTPLGATMGTGAYGNVDAAGRYIGTPFGQAGSNVSTFIGSQGGYDMGANYVGTPFGQAQPSSTTNIYVNGATQQLLNELRNGLIDSSASGSFASINSAAG